MKSIIRISERTGEKCFCYTCTNQNQKSFSDMFLLTMANIPEFPKFDVLGENTYEHVRVE